MSTCVFAKSKGVSFVRFNRFLGVDCYAATNKCLECKPGFYIKGGTADQCIQDKEIATLISPRYGVDKAAAKPTIKPCSDPACLSCASDYTQCACNTGQFYYAITNNPVENKVCSSTSDVAGYGVSSSSHRFTGLTLLEPCSVSPCQDCKQNNLECRLCPTGYYYKPPTNGVYEGCYQGDSLPEGWGSRESSLKLFDCTEDPYYYDSVNRICHYKAQIKIEDITTKEDKTNNKSVFQILVVKGQLSITGGTPTSPGYLELSNDDLEDFISYHFQIQMNPPIQITREVRGHWMMIIYPGNSSNFNISFKMITQSFKAVYNGKQVESPSNSLLMFSTNQSSNTLHFQVTPNTTNSEETRENPQNSETPRIQYLTERQITYTKLAAKTGQVISLTSKILSIVLLVANIDLTSSIFKIIQLITIFDKLRFINVEIKNSFGDFIRYIGELFKMEFLQKDDYHLASFAKHNKFNRFDYSVIAYRNSPAKILFFTAALLLEGVSYYLIHGLKKIKKKEFLRMEKRGCLIKNLRRTSSGMFLMTLSDVFFSSGHQILHQNLNTLLKNPIYLPSYVASLIIFLTSCCLIQSSILSLIELAPTKSNEMPQTHFEEPKEGEQKRAPNPNRMKMNERRRNRVIPDDLENQPEALKSLQNSSSERESGGTGSRLLKSKSEDCYGRFEYFLFFEVLKFK